MNMAVTATARRRVAIPRLQRPSNVLSKTKDKRRVARACTSCRSLKIKCSGVQPTCERCMSSGLDCVYNMPRFDRMKILTERCDQMAELLTSLHLFATDEQSLRIREIFSAIEEENLKTRRLTAPSSLVIEHTSTSSSETSSEVHNSNLVQPSSELHHLPLTGPMQGLVVVDEFVQGAMTTSLQGRRPGEAQVLGYY